MLTNTSSSLGQVETLPVLQPIANELEQLKSPSDMSRRAALCRRALKLVSREQYPDSWASIQDELGKSLWQNPLGDRSENLELAIAAFQQALEVYTRQDWPMQWGQTMNNLGLAYQNRIHGDQSKNLEQAIDAYQQSLQEMSPETAPIEWAQTTMNLGTAFSNRIEGNRADNLEQAITLYRQALDVATEKALQTETTQIQVNLANAYANRVYGDRTENLEQAVDTYNQVLDVVTRDTMPDEWAQVQVNLANAYAGRISGDRAENIEKSLFHYQQALEVISRDDMPLEWAQIMSNLASVYTDRVAGNRSDNLEESISTCEQALQVRTRQVMPIEWAKTMIKLANAYSKRICGDQAENLEQAIDFYQQALEVINQETLPVDWADVMHNLGKTYQKRIQGDRSENLRQAIDYYQNALNVRSLDHFPAKHRKTQQSLGDLYFMEQDWANAFEAYTVAMEAGDALLAAAYTEAGRQAEIGENARLYASSAYCLLRLGQPAEALCQLEKGKTRLLAQVLALSNVDLTILSEDQQQTLCVVRDKIRSLEAEMRLPPDTPLRRDDRELAEALHSARTELNDLVETIRTDHPEFMPVGLELSEILALVPQNGALIAPLITPQGSAVFVIPYGIDTIAADHVILFDAFTGNDLSNLLVGNNDNRGWLLTYLDIQNDGAWQNWKATIEDITSQLWQFLMGPIYDQLQTSGVEEGASVVLMPHSGLSFLPLHAAWREAGGVKRSFLDDYPVSYTPSAYALSVSQRRLQQNKHLPHSLLAVVNPIRDLDYASIEGEVVASLFETEAKQVLTGPEATPLAVMQAAPGISLLHFSCHGRYDWQNAMQSGLVLGNNEVLTLSIIIASLNLGAARLVTLSACETGLTDIWQSLEEYIGLSVGFLQAGAPGVVSTLWAVNDLSTMLLMERFYQNHLQHGMEIPKALRQAQLWLRDVTAQKLSDYFSAEREELLVDERRMPTDVVSEGFRHFAEMSPDERPFAHPYYWAAFTFSGA